MPYEDDKSCRPAPAGELAAFWNNIYRSGRLPLVLLYLSSALVMILLLSYVVQGLIDNVLGTFSFPVFIFPLLLLAMFIFYGPALARQTRVQFEGKFRPGIPESELRELMIEMSAKALELIALIVAVTCALCIGVYEAAQFLSLQDSTTVVLLAVTVVNAFFVSLLVSSLGHYNRTFLRKTFSEEEYRRYTSPGNYKVILFILVVVNVLAAIYLVFG